MEEMLQSLEADQQAKRNYHLVLGIAVSVVLHLVCTVALLTLPKGSPAPPASVTYVDLRAPQQPAPLTVPPKETTPAPVVRKPEPTPAAEPSPEPEQAKATPDQPPAAPQETKIEEQRSQTSLGLGLTKGYFQTIGNGETLRDDIKEYYLAMLQRINEKWWLDQIDKKRVAPIMIAITVARNGEIVASQVVASSGNRRYDRAVLAALAAANPLPPLPEGYPLDFFQAPIRLVPPLNLMAW